MTLVLEGGGDRRLVLAENRSCGEGQRGWRGLFFRIAVTWQRMQGLLFVLLTLVVVLETLSNSFKTLHQN